MEVGIEVRDGYSGGVDVLLHADDAVSSSLSGLSSSASVDVSERVVSSGCVSSEIKTRAVSSSVVRLVAVIPAEDIA